MFSETECDRVENKEIKSVMIITSHGKAQFINPANIAVQILLIRTCVQHLPVSAELCTAIQCSSHPTGRHTTFQNPADNFKHS